MKRGLADLLIERACYLVYRYTGQCPSMVGSARDIDWTFLRERYVSLFFHGDKKRERVFRKFVRKDFIGLVLHRGDEWITYAWMSTPTSPPPVHLPAWVAKLGANWVFYCSTKPQYRNQGYYKLAMRLLVEQAFQLEPDPTVYIDTDASNIPSRRAILSVGFQPAGVLQCTRYGVPGIGYLTLGKWQREADHPNLETHNAYTGSWRR